MSPFYQQPRKGPDGMNRTERHYAFLIGHRPDTVLVMFEGVKLRLACNTFYTPDFLVVRQVGPETLAVELHEVKGGLVRDDARVKWKAVAEQHCSWATFVWAQEVAPGQWRQEVYGHVESHSPARDALSQLRRGGALDGDAGGQEHPSGRGLPAGRPGHRGVQPQDHDHTLRNLPTGGQVETPDDGGGKCG